MAEQGFRGYCAGGTALLFSHSIGQRESQESPDWRGGLNIYMGRAAEGSSGDLGQFCHRSTREYVGRVYMAAIGNGGGSLRNWKSPSLLALFYYLNGIMWTPFLCGHLVICVLTLGPCSSKDPTFTPFIRLVLIYL